MGPGNFDSSDPNVPAVSAAGTNGANGITATSDTGEGIRGVSRDGGGVVGESTNGIAIYAQTSSDSQYTMQAQYLGGTTGAVIGVGGNGDGVSGTTASSAKSAVFGRNDSTANATAPGGSGVFGLTFAPGGVGVFGANNSGGPGRGVQGNGPEAGVGGFSTGGTGVLGQTDTGTGVVGFSSSGTGVLAQSPGGIGLLASGATAGRFEGNVEVTGDVILTGADCAEEFDIAEAVDIDPGTVMVLDQDGALQQSQQAYDKRVAGVVSGAGDYKPGVILDRRQSRDNRVAVALVGKVYCKVDAQYAPIEVGDLLTTSPTPGHAMKAEDPFKAFGSVIGKALRSLETGQGVIPILIALQ